MRGHDQGLAAEGQVADHLDDAEPRGLRRLGQHLPAGVAEGLGEGPTRERSRVLIDVQHVTRGPQLVDCIEDRRVAPARTEQEAVRGGFRRGDHHSGLAPHLPDAGVRGVTQGGDPPGVRGSEGSVQLVVLGQRVPNEQDLAEVGRDHLEFRGRHGSLLILGFSLSFRDPAVVLIDLVDSKTTAG